LADLAIELLLLLDELYAVAGLVETCVAVVAVKHLVFIVTLGAEADFTVSLEEAF
jgi:hypothetical protein